MAVEYKYTRDEHLEFLRSNLARLALATRSFKKDPSDANLLRIQRASHWVATGAADIIDGCYKKDTT